MKKIAFVGLLISLFLCACGGGDKSASSLATEKLIEPAALISAQEAKDLTGVSFAPCPVKEQPAVGLKLCVYEQEGAFLQVGISQKAFYDPKNLAAGNSPESIYRATKAAFKDAPSISGVGDENFIAPPGIHILKAGYYLTISVGNSKDTEKIKAAAQVALTNLNKSLGQ